ncbi:MAG: uracil-DNA glycosylase [Nitrososphaerota archaeon]|nr:uracil-DNA glycosylase [Nitrososphaerota archaeon]
MNEFEKSFSEAMQCKKCRLWENRTNVVFGEGDLNSKIMLIGEAPGLNEDKEGRPFVGHAGKILNEKLLKIVGLERKDVYITNVVKCRPPKNREPFEDEIDACFPYLNIQIQFIKPKLIITLGNIATATLFKKFNLKLTPMSQIHGKVFSVITLSHGKIKIIPSYHPATTLYNPRVLSLMMEDWKQIGEIIKSFT